jgi:hypothetical protein
MIKDNCSKIASHKTTEFAEKLRKLRRASRALLCQTSRFNGFAHAIAGRLARAREQAERTQAGGKPCVAPLIGTPHQRRDRRPALSAQN